LNGFGGIGKLIERRNRHKASKGGMPMDFFDFIKDYAPWVFRDGPNVLLLLVAVYLIVTSDIKIEINRDRKK
jgi:hypothetical protein